MSLRLIRLIATLSMLVMLVSCAPSKWESYKYEGNSLTIGVIGTTPNVLEDNITFKDIDINSLKNELKFGSYDAIVITKDSFEQASDSKHVNIYTESHIPFVFIESEKSYLPFISKDHDYKSAPLVDSLAHAILYFHNDNGEVITKKYSLYNDERTERNINEVYSRVFYTVEEISNSPLN